MLIVLTIVATGKLKLVCMYMQNCKSNVPIRQIFLHRLRYNNKSTKRKGKENQNIEPNNRNLVTNKQHQQQIKPCH